MISTETNAALPIRGRRFGPRVPARFQGSFPGRPSLPRSRQTTIGIAAATLIGLALVTAMVPIAGRGDYGQWLMTSRYYLGQDVPDYRVISSLPPLVPVLIAVIRVFIVDPVLALTILNVSFLVGLGVAFYAAGSWFYQSRLIGAVGVVCGLLLTDRFLELFAFGGLFQAAAVLVMTLTVACLARAGRGGVLHLRWWIAGFACLWLVTLTHVGTALIAVPVGVALAALVAVHLFAQRVSILPAVLVAAIALATLAAYWFLVLVPASRDYLTNPASLAYRGVDRLFFTITSYPPTMAVVAIGLATIAIGLRGSIVHRRIDGPVFLAAWLVCAWGALAASAVTGAATDYPRFVTVLLAPLVVAAGAGVVQIGWLISAGLTRIQGRLSRTQSLQLLVVGLIVAASPMAIARFDRQASVYQPLDAPALTAAAHWMDAALGDRDLVVLANVREGKWIEGLTGRATLFSQPVRYAFRSLEWQRSIDADALLRSTEALTNGLWLASFREWRGSGQASVPMRLSFSMNHGGEFVRVLEEVRAGSALLTPDGSATVLERLSPVSMTSRASSTVSSLTTRFATPPGTSRTELVRTVRMWADGTTMELTGEASAGTVRIELGAPAGLNFRSLDANGGEAEICFAQTGDSPPCLRLLTPTADARMEITPTGTIRITTSSSQRLDVYATALTPGRASVGLSVLDPLEIVNRYGVGAALLYAADAAFGPRAARLERLGFELGPAFGPYRVLVRSSASAPAAGKLPGR